MAAWIVLHDNDSRKGRTYYVQVSHISRIANHTFRGAVIYFAGDADDWITVKEDVSEIAEMIGTTEK